jgi:hypothetical protein
MPEFDAWPATQIVLADGFKNINKTGISIKTRVKALRDAATQGSVPRAAFLRLQASLDSSINEWNTYSALPGMLNYAIEQFENPTFPALNSFNQMKNAAIALRNWINNNLPRHDGAVLLRSSNAAGQEVDLYFDTNDTAPFVVLADAFDETIS